MPHYFFNRRDGVVDPDREGIELSDLVAARIEAVLFAADSIKDKNFKIWDGGKIFIDVEDSARESVFVISIEAHDVVKS